MAPSQGSSSGVANAPYTRGRSLSPDEEVSDSPVAAAGGDQEHGDAGGQGPPATDAGRARTSD